MPPLPYAYDALEPYIDEETMKLHHDKHHAAYVAKLNEAVNEVPELRKRSLDDMLKNLSTVPAEVRTAIKNNGGGHYNHSFFWLCMSPLVVVNRQALLSKHWSNSLNPFQHLKSSFQMLLRRYLAVAGPGSVWIFLVPQDYYHGKSGYSSCTRVTSSFST